MKAKVSADQFYRTADISTTDDIRRKRIKQPSLQRIALRVL